ncbi:hypothetical protein [Hyphococcus luteus]|uniref:hypothetical protein n=1 Tax=Hyphococcus luteus TaxID=2058213 RepID=UPI0010574510|nr:hypothetical protein [Marinicaulis flavus]
MAWVCKQCWDMSGHSTTYAEIQSLLVASRSGDEASRDALFRLVHRELSAIAAFESFCMSSGCLIALCPAMPSIRETDTLIDIDTTAYFEDIIRVHNCSQDLFAHAYRAQCRQERM